MDTSEVGRELERLAAKLDVLARNKHRGLELSAIATRLRELAARGQTYGGNGSSGEAWQPLATAPKDGTVVMFHVPGERKPHMCRADDYWYMRKPDGTGFAFWLDGATHWMPLPAPPPEPLVEGTVTDTATEPSLSARDPAADEARNTLSTEHGHPTNREPE
jgi:hypothetical protein